MTNEEAINMIKAFKEKPALINEVDSVEVAVLIDEALEMAIKALEQQPCEDCISRAEVLKIINFEERWIFDVWHLGDLCISNVNIAFSGLRYNVKNSPVIYPKAKMESEDKK